jgi:hypothetical protein
MHKRGLLSLQQSSSSSQQCSSRMVAISGIEQQDGFIIEEKKVRRRPPHINTNVLMLYEVIIILPYKPCVNLYDRSSQRLNHYVVHNIKFSYLEE